MCDLLQNLRKHEVELIGPVTSTKAEPDMQLARNQVASMGDHSLGISPITMNS